MAESRVRLGAPITKILAAIVAFATVAACAPEPLPGFEDDVYAPGVDHRKEAVDGIEVGNRLMEVEQYELALEAFTRAALVHGMTTEILTGIGTANLGLGRLGQSEENLRRAVAEAPEWPEAWNNLGVVLMERGKITEAQQVFQKAYALDNGESDSIRENLRVALSKSENSDNNSEQNEDYKLVQRGSGNFVIRKVP
ncbi:tetratricopeptide repeat protein [Phaeobacter marinintestinus]|uniref:tetratricopeptide repeat protein n=1 Tax=Falsiphaeobacter marinintestinus TaxID=1492905 RepID=UPI0011B5C63A|nr:tetratricopeptide repeat protein [Phaeobacter marinintestinus]